MRIAVNTRFLLKDRLEGIGWYTYNILQEMVQAHPEDEFIFFFDRAYDESFVFSEKVTPVVLFPPARHGVLWYWWFEWSLPRALRKHKADVFLSPDGFLSLRTQVKTIMITHDIAHVHYTEGIPRWAVWYYNHFTPRYLRRADRILAVSEFTKQDIVQTYGIEAEKIGVAYNGYRAIFQPLNSTEQKQIREKYAAGEAYFFYIGAIHPRKNVHRLISAFDAFKTQTGAKVKLLLGGRFAWQTGEVKTAYDTAKHAKDIVFLGYISEEELPRLMAAALALTYISLFEGFGVPLLEAMHCEIPVVTSNVSSMPEVIGEAGLTVDPYQEEEIVDALAQLYTDENLRGELIAKARVQRQKFTWKKTAKLIYKELKNLSETKK